MNTSTRWWRRHCLQYQARKSSRQTVRWPILSLPLPSGPGIAISADCFGSLPVTPKGNSYILLFNDRYSRRTDMYAVSAAKFTAESTADIRVNNCIPLWGCPVSLHSDNALQLCSKPSHAIYKLHGVRKIMASSYQPHGNGGVEHVIHTVAQILAMVVNERQDDSDAHLPHVKFVCNNSVSAAIGLAPSEVHMNRLPRLPLPVFEHPYACGHQSLARDQLEYVDWLPTAGGAYVLVREQHVLNEILCCPTGSRNSPLTPSVAGY